MLDAIQLAMAAVRHIPGRQIRKGERGMRELNSLVLYLAVAVLLGSVEAPSLGVGSTLLGHPLHHIGWVPEALPSSVPFVSSLGWSIETAPVQYHPVRREGTFKPQGKLAAVGSARISVAATRKTNPANGTGARLLGLAARPSIGPPLFR